METLRKIITIEICCIFFLSLFGCNSNSSNSSNAEVKEENSIVTQKEEKETAETKNESLQDENLSEDTSEKNQHHEMKDLPKTVLDAVEAQKSQYDIDIGVGIYSLDGEKGYVYNELYPISGGCTIKAIYALYVLKECQRIGIDILTYTLTYEEDMYNDGTGEIKYANYGTEFTVDYLLDRLLVNSDNTAYNVLVSGFPISRFREFLKSINGQNLGDTLYGDASVEQRKNEWLEIYKYINSNEKYSDYLRNYLTNNQYCYLTYWMQGSHTFMNKSGWSDTLNYTCACDCAIIDNSYLLIVMTQDYNTGIPHFDTVEAIGASVEEYISSNSGKLF